MSTAIHEIAASVKAARKAKALTQQELGQRVGLPQSHISKIEKGGVDLQLSSLVEIARALELEVKLVPRKALPAVEGAVRAHGTTVETSRALATLADQAQLAENIKASFPDLTQLKAFQAAIRDIPRIQFDNATLKALQQAIGPARELQNLFQSQGGAAALAKQLEEATSAIRHFRNTQAHTELIDAPRQLPAYRLEEDDE